MNLKFGIKNTILVLLVILSIFLIYQISKIQVDKKERFLELTSNIDTIGQYAKNNGRVYWVSSPQLVSSKNSTSFRVIKGDLKPSIYGSQYIVFAYATDGTNVYYMGSMLPEGTSGVDVNSFKPIENGNYFHLYAKDNNHVYYKSAIIAGADPQTFKILWTIPPEGCSQPPYSKDATHVFYENKLVEGADPNTFEMLYDDYGKDKNHVFFKDKLQEGVSPVNFKAPITCVYD